MLVTPVSYARGPGFEAQPRDRLSRILANYSNFSRITAELFVVQQFVYILLYMRNDEKWYFCVYGHLRENTFAFTSLKCRLLLF